MLIFTYGVLKATKTCFRLFYRVLHACTMFLNRFRMFFAKFIFLTSKKILLEKFTFWIFQCFFMLFLKVSLARSSPKFTKLLFVVPFTVCNLCYRRLPVKKRWGQNIDFSSRYTQNGACVSGQKFTCFEATFVGFCVFGRALSPRNSYLKLIITCLHVIHTVLNKLEKYFALCKASLGFMTL